MSVCLSVTLSVCLFSNFFCSQVSVCLCTIVLLPLWLSACPTARLSICDVCLSVCPSVRLSVCRLSISLYVPCGGYNEKNAELTAIGKFFYKMTLPYMDTIVAGGGGGDLRGGSDPGLGSTDLRQSLRARKTCCTGALTQVMYTHIPLSVNQGPGDILHRGTDTRSVTHVPVSITQGTGVMLHRGTDPGQLPTCICQSLRAGETCCTGALTQVRYTHIPVSITQGP
jgi:hypothetical protein